MRANYVPDVLDAGSVIEASKGARPKARPGHVNGSRNDLTRTTLRDYLVEQWLPSIEFELEPNTIESYRSNIHLHILPALGDIPLGEFTRSQIKQFYSDLLSNDAARLHKPLSKGTVCRIHSVLHRAFRILVDAGVLEINPAVGARPRTRKLDKYEIRIWSPQELGRFLSSTRRTPLGSLWHVMAFTGMRRGEVLGLRWYDIHEDARFLSVRRALNQVRTESYISAPKSAQSRVLELDEKTLKVLRRHRQRVEVERRAAVGTRSDDYVFTTVEGAPYMPAGISQAFTKAVATHGLPRIRLHDLRHTHASHLIESGANPKVVQERLGHADVVITLNLYSHLFPTTQRSAIDDLTAFYEPG